MKIIDIIQTNNNNEFLHEELIELNEGWSFYALLKLNSSIFVGWLINDDLLIVNGDGIFLYDIESKNIIMEDYESNFKKNLSTDNLKYSLKERDENIDVFGLRGGGGNLLTIENDWKLEIINIHNNYKIPRLMNYKTRKSWFFELHEISYDGYMYCGFSKTQKYFLVMGDQGINVFKRNF
ncbi:hypothetical protein N0B16_00805 [Chryseobacterium sp. GMJ5]|uniref:Uncharacterized protein n=1 Tax=Chryseobacterium gilvum TaxID=2976534 RepID=A0ABT2VTL7_9FLAO|nr:hypothetical protein [Chryseobacterium gilvum]MCU7612968.1 hypothetical protein [Chryseobacterium gilvum]